MLSFVVPLLAFTLLEQISPASSPSTQSAIYSAPLTELDQFVRESLAQLDNPDPSARDRAVEQLMGLQRNDLPSLVAAVRAAPRISLEQESALRTIVSQVMLTGEPVAQDDTHGGFLGVKLAPDFDGFQDRYMSAKFGAFIYGRIPGYVGYRRLRDGDIIVGINGDADRIYSGPQLSETLRKYRSGQTVQLQVQRNGRALIIPVTFSARPADQNGIGKLRNDQDKSVVSDFWDEQFAPLLEKNLPQ